MISKKVWIIIGIMVGITTLGLVFYKYHHLGITYCHSAPGENGALHCHFIWNTHLH